MISFEIITCVVLFTRESDLFACCEIKGKKKKETGKENHFALRHENTSAKFKRAPTEILITTW